jgi:gas vesicle protein
MAFRQGFLVGAAAGAIATLLYTPLEGRDARAIVLGPFGWREVETEPEVAWSPQPAEPGQASEQPSP